MHPQSWSLAYEKQRYVVDVPLGYDDAGKPARFHLRLAGGTRYQRRTDALRDTSGGGGELALYRQRIDNHNRVMVKIAAWLPRPEKAGGTRGLLPVRTAAEALLVAVNAQDGRIWSWHGDYMRRWIREHYYRLQCWAGDQKMEHRPVAAFRARREAARTK